MNSESTRRTGPRIASLIAIPLGILALLVRTHPQTEPSQKPTPSEAIALVSGTDRYPSSSASDWVTYADHVVVAEAVAERESPPSQTGTDHGEGLIGRQVTMQVKQVLWSSKSAPAPPPEEWERLSMGWVFKGKPSNRHRVGLADSPRIQVGHTYILAIEWSPDPCAERSGNWLGLGEGSSVPFDDNIVGVGEYEGRVRKLDEARKETSISPKTFEHRMTGTTSTELARELRSADPVPATSRYEPPTPRCQP